MEPTRKRQRYQRLLNQISELLQEPGDPDTRMATIAAVLHHKMEYFFWTGFYLLNHGELVVRNYQGPVACMLLPKNTGVCWAGINRGQTIIVPDVHKFPGHIACDSRSRSEIVVPVRDSLGRILGVLDVDSKELDSFDATDAEYLERITGLIHASRKPHTSKPTR
jgi:L-methionine (R)-S-oxide reductase